MQHFALRLARVRQSLANDPRQGSRSALCIVDSERNPMVISEIELREIPVQVPLGAVLIDAFHAALEHAEIAFDRVRVDVAAAVFAGVVIDHAMLGELAAHQSVVYPSGDGRGLLMFRLRRR